MPPGSFYHLKKLKASHFSAEMKDFCYIMYTIKHKPEDFKVKEVSNVIHSGKGSYVIAVLKKKDFTTLQALKLIANSVGLKLKHLDRKSVV